MRLPPLVIALGFAGLLPFLAAPLWLTLAADSAPPWLDRAWLAYVVLVAAFLAGSFWGFALPAVQGPAGLAGVLIGSGLMLLTWVAMLMPFDGELLGLSVVFMLLLLADFWRERTLDTIGGYFMMRTTLTVGVLVAIAWRWALGATP
jgi:hypothetical protein